MIFNINSTRGHTGSLLVILISARPKVVQMLLRELRIVKPSTFQDMSSAAGSQWYQRSRLISALMNRRVNRRRRTIGPVLNNSEWAGPCSALPRRVPDLHRLCTSARWEITFQFQRLRAAAFVRRSTHGSYSEIVSFANDRPLRACSRFEIYTLFVSRYSTWQSSRVAIVVSNKV